MNRKQEDGGWIESRREEGVDRKQEGGGLRRDKRTQRMGSRNGRCKPRRLTQLGHCAETLPVTPHLGVALFASKVCCVSEPHFV